MYSIIYETATGNFTALTDYLADPLPTGLSSRSIGTVKPDMNSYQWDAATLGLVPRTPQRLISKIVFIQRFNNNERITFFSFYLDVTKTDAQRKNVFAFMQYLVYLDVINLDDTSVVTGVNYLETVGVIATGRAAQILS